MINYVFNNIDWIFSGIGVIIIATLANYLLAAKNKHKSSDFTFENDNQNKHQYITVIINIFSSQKKFWM
jgi:hypothetical protein